MITYATDQSHLFQDLQATMQGANYVPVIIAWSFEIDSDTFTFEDLLAISNSTCDQGKIQPLRGKLKISSFKVATQTINECLAYVSNGAFPVISADSTLKEARIISFWDNVQKMISLEIKNHKTYQYFPEYDTCFYLGLWWDCVYIFIAGNKGFLVAMGAYD